jgi:hypothetical protein
LDDIKYVSIFDDAIDHARSKVKGEDGYVGTCNLAHLVFKPGAVPVYFHLRPFGGFEKGYIGRVESQSEKVLRSLEVGLVGIENLPGREGRLWSGSQPLDLPNEPKRLIWSPAELKELDATLGEEIQLELYSRLLEKSSRGKLWGVSARPYTLPPYLLGELAKIERRSAA